MTLAALALALAVPGAAKPPSRPGMQAKDYGVLLVADGGGGSWRAALGSLRQSMKDAAVESVESTDSTTLQRAVDKLRAQHVGKIVAVPLMPVAESPEMDHVRYLFGVREKPSDDRPDVSRENAPQRALGGGNKSALVLTDPRAPKRLRSEAELVLAPTIDKSQALAEILSARAAALAREPGKEAVVLVGRAPRSDKALEDWKTATQAIAEAVRLKGGFREAGVLRVRDGVRAGQQDKDRDENKALLRSFGTHGAVVAVPLAADGANVGRMLQRQLGSMGYRWNGKGFLGEPKLAEWIQTTAASSSNLPDSRQFRDNVGGNR